jgi:adenosylhomocysteine nucleosidase
MIGVVVGLEAEARIARRWAAAVEVGGGDSAGAARAATVLAARPGITALVSFGLAGGLDPALRPGDLLIPSRIIDGKRSWPTDAALGNALGGGTGHTMLGGGAVLATAAAKRVARSETGADAVDLESAAVARAAGLRGLPFAALRAICDHARRSLPLAAIVALDRSGRVGPLRVLGAVLARPWEIPALLALARDATLATRALKHRVRTTPAVNTWP